MNPSYALLESILWERYKGYWLLERHIERLKISAKALKFSYEEGAMHKAIEDCAKGLQGERYKTRFQLFFDGSIKYDAEEISPISATTVWKVAIAPHRLDRQDALIYHKTTRRDLYAAALSWGKDNHGTQEVLLRNEEGALCEGSYSNLFVKDGDILLTPPLSNGFLAGTYRAQLIAEGKAIEAQVSQEMLEELPIYMGNSVRGLIRAEKIV